MTQLVKEEIQTSGLKRRFRQARLKLGKNHLGADIAAGDLVLIGLPNQPPEICFVENAEVGDVTLRTPGGRGIGLPNGKENEGHLYAPHHRHPPPEGRRGSKGAEPAPRVDSEVCRHCWGDIWPDAHLPRVRMGRPRNNLGRGKDGGTLHHAIQKVVGGHLWFHTHISVFKNVEATPQEKARFKASNMYVPLYPINLEMVTLREKKIPGEAMKQPLKVS